MALSNTFRAEEMCSHLLPIHFQDSQFCRLLKLAVYYCFFKGFRPVTIMADKETRYSGYMQVHADKAFKTLPV